MSEEISYGHEIFRKTIHLSSLWMVASIAFFPKWFNIALFVFLLASIILVEYGNYRQWKLFTLTYGSLFNRILREKERQEKFHLSGASYVIAAALMVTAIFPKIIAMTALSIMLIGDTSAALVGRKFGRHKINGGTKSIEGSIAFWLSSAAVLLFFYLAYHQPLPFLPCGLIGITVATFAEIYRNRLHLDDNFSIPLATGLFLSLSLLL